MEIKSNTNFVVVSDHPDFDMVRLNKKYIVSIEGPIFNKDNNELIIKLHLIDNSYCELDIRHIYQVKEIFKKNKNNFDIDILKRDINDLIYKLFCDY